MKTGKLELIGEGKGSKVYREVLDGKVYCLKTRTIVAPKASTRGLPVDFIANYATLFSLKDKADIVKVYDVWEGDGLVYIRMEYLKEYVCLRDWLVTARYTVVQQEQIVIKIFKILSNQAAQGCINADCGDGNWMIHPKTLDLKMIDFDFFMKTPSRESRRLHWLGCGFIDLLKKLRFKDGRAV